MCLGLCLSAPWRRGPFPGPFCQARSLIPRGSPVPVAAHARGPQKCVLGGGAGELFSAPIAGRTQRAVPLAVACCPSCFVYQGESRARLKISLQLWRQGLLDRWFPSSAAAENCLIRALVKMQTPRLQPLRGSIVSVSASGCWSFENPFSEQLNGTPGPVPSTPLPS